MNNCSNCRAEITENDRAMFKADLIKHGYKGEILNTIPDLCACCSELRDSHNQHIDELDNYDHFCGY